jgi:hypothetical protein
VGSNPTHVKTFFIVSLLKKSVFQWVLCHLKRNKETIITAITIITTITIKAIKTGLTAILKPVYTGIVFLKF